MRSSRNRYVRGVVQFLIPAGIWLCLNARVPAQEAAPPLPDFGTGQVWKVDLELTAAEYTAMQPAMGGFPGPGGPPPAQPAGGREVERNQFGTAFPWAVAKAGIDATPPADVGLRYSGDGSYFVAAAGLKRPLKIRFSAPAGANTRSLLLQSMPLDASKSREALALTVFRALQIPAPRVAFAEVSLTVPGQFDRENLGLFTVVEGLDESFLAREFGSAGGLLLRPAGQQGLAHLGDDWNAYAAWRPEGNAAPENTQRVFEFTKLINQGSDEEFARRIDEYLDVDAFLRFMAANTLTSNITGFFGIGGNYVLALRPDNRKFVFLPGDLEQSFANFQFMGSADELMNLSLTKPYPGENKLPDRLLALPGLRERYNALVKDAVANVFTKDRLTQELAAINAATQGPREREAEAARRRPPAAPAFGGFAAAPPPELPLFIDRRLASIEKQLAGTGEGYVPRPMNFGFGGGGGGGGFQRRNPEAVTEQQFRDLVKAPEGFTITLFGRPPETNYPTAVVAGTRGEVYVASDEQGSLGREPNGGKILQLVDADGDGVTDRVTEFARVDHPRGVTAVGNTVWVMHPPTLTVFHDDNGDGVADRNQVLVTGLTTSQIDERGGDHTTNGVRMGIDGWLYIGVGDYGIKLAQGTDGSTLSLRGGGIVRVRPDGTELELFSRGLRNPFDIAIDPYLNLFTRDNTNDGGGWDTRVSHLIQTGNYGYSQLFANFTDEIMPTLGTYGNGGGTADVFVQNPQWPERFQGSLLTADWGRSEVYLHPLSANGPTFATSQEVFLTVPRATGMDMDASGRLYVGSWHGGDAASFQGPNVGFVAGVTPPGYQPQPIFDVAAASLPDLVQQFRAPQPQPRLAAQREILNRGRSAEATQLLSALASDEAAALASRVAAIFTLKQLDGAESHPLFKQLVASDSVREFALKALTDRKSQLAGVEAALFVAALNDASPRVRAQAVISLSRLGDASVAGALLPLTSRPEGSEMPTQTPVQNQPDADRVIPHLAVQALVSLGAVDVCLAGLDGPHRDGALWALRWMHTSPAVDGLIAALRNARDSELRRGILVALIRLCHREADYDGSWWGIRPDSSGPYWDGVAWEQTPRIEGVLKTAIVDSTAEEAAFLKSQLARHRLSLPGLGGEVAGGGEEQSQPVVAPKADPSNPNHIGNLPVNEAMRRALAASGNPQQGEQLFRAQNCVACHTSADGQKPKGPHLVDIGKRYQPRELVESILTPSAKLAQGYESWTFALADGRVFTGFIVSERADTITFRESNSLQREVKRAEIEERVQQKQSAMPEGLAANLTPEQLADLVAYLQSLK